MERIRMGLSSNSEHFHSHENHMLTNYLGSKSFYPEIHALSPNDYCCFLLCTDGLSKSIELDTLYKMVNSVVDDPAILCNKLIDAAQSAGSSDDITVLAIVLEEIN
jgi:serine/threonine protein phosphatase PrpC